MFARIKNIKSKKIKIRDALIFANSLLIIFTVVIIIFISFSGSRDSVYSVSDKFMKEIVKSVVSKTQAYLKPSERANLDIAFHYWNKGVGNFYENEEIALNYFKEILKTNEEFVMVYFADTKGNLIMALRMPDGSISKKYIKRTSKGVETTYLHENQEYNALYPNTVESFAKGYDPRSRIWYKTAVQKKTLFWTDVYIFATGKLPGFSSAMPIYNKEGKLIGVASIDIGIKNLSLFLGKIALTKNAKLFITDDKQRIIAEPLKKGESINKLFTESTEDGKKKLSLRTIETVEDVTISESYKNYLTQKNKNKPFSFRIGRSRYFSNYAALTFKQGIDFRVGIVIPDRDIMGVVYKNNDAILVFSVILLIVVIALSAAISSFISRPMEELSFEMNQIKNFFVSDDNKIKTSIQEIDKMVEVFEGMKKGLLNFKKYVPSDLVSQLVKNNQDANIGGDKKELTIFFSDIANFTSISEKMHPEEIAAQLSDYFSEMSQTILSNKGTVDKYIGDAIMAFWGAPNELKNHEYLACQSALKCNELIRNLSNKWVREGKPKFKTRIGIHTGEVIVGNIGYEKRIDYTVIGDNVNLASRLENINKYYSTEIIVSETTRDIVRDDFEFRTLDKISVKGKLKPITIYELLAEKGKLNKGYLKLYQIYDDGVNYYFDGNWEKTIKYMDALLQYKKDIPASIIKQRAEAYLKNPPENWNGVFTFQKK